MMDRHQMLFLGAVTPLRMHGVIVLVEVAAGRIFGVNLGLPVMMASCGVGNSEAGNDQTGSYAKFEVLVFHTVVLLVIGGFWSPFITQLYRVKIGRASCRERV